MHLEFYRRDVTDDAVTLGISCWCGVKDLSRDGQSCAETRERSAACYWAYFPLICMEDIDHDVWRALLTEVRQRGSHALKCSVTECGYMRGCFRQRKYTARYVREERRRLFVEMSLMAATTAERDFVQDDNKNLATLF